MQAPCSAGRGGEWKGKDKHVRKEGLATDQYPACQSHLMLSLFRELLIIGQKKVCGVLFFITFFFGWLLVGCTRELEKMVVWVQGQQQCGEDIQNTFWSRVATRI